MRFQDVVSGMYGAQCDGTKALKIQNKIEYLTCDGSQRYVIIDECRAVFLNDIFIRAYI